MVRLPKSLESMCYNNSMNWKHWPYWLKGGVIGGGLSVLFVILYIPCEQAALRTFVESGGVADLADLKCFPLEWPMLPIQIIIPLFLSTFSGTILIVASILLWFFIGSLTGTLVGYIKSKNRNLQ